MKTLIGALTAALALCAALALQTAAPAAPASPEAGVHALTQVNFRLHRVVAQAEFEASPESFVPMESASIGGEIIRMPVEREPLLTITELDRAVIRRGEYGLHHLDLYLTQEDAERFADLTEDQAGQRVLVVSRDSILLDLFLTGRDESGRFSLFYANTPLEQIENVLEVLQVPYTLQTSPSEFIPETEADEHFLQGMQAVQMSRPQEALNQLRQAITVGGDDYALRPDVLTVMGSLFLELGDRNRARACFQEIRDRHSDHPDIVPVLMQLLRLAREANDPDEQMALAREIVAAEGSATHASITAQVLLVDLLQQAGEDEEAERANDLLITMLENRLAVLPIRQRFDTAYELMRAHLRFESVDEAEALAQRQIDQWIDTPQAQVLKLFIVVDLFGEGGHRDAQLAIIDHFTSVFEERHSTEEESLEAVWLQVERLRERVESSAVEGEPVTAEPASPGK